MESQTEWEAIVSGLHGRGVLEAEVEEQTVRHQGRPVYNGAFVVHKKWARDNLGRESRVLRLIINSVPANAKNMGYAGLWPKLVLCENEVMVMYSEDQSGCFAALTFRTGAPTVLSSTSRPKTRPSPKR